MGGDAEGGGEVITRIMGIEEEGGEGRRVGDREGRWRGEEDMEEEIGEEK